MQPKQGLLGFIIPWIHPMRPTGFGTTPTEPMQLIAVVRISAAQEGQSTINKETKLYIKKSPR